ncbi:hypothetical protein SESBI_07200 [Sesbania bispinosa]|nr:hypothetical protein SESBI_07200 [Sesbania bispinosa]
MKGRGIDNGGDSRSGPCKSSSSSSVMRRKVCSCGEEVVLFKSNSANNLGRMFWRCPNWNVSLEWISVIYS